MKKIFIVISALTLIVGCKKFESLNTNTKLATEVPSNFLLSSAQKNLVDVMTSSNVNTNIFRLWSQQWTQTTYFDESRYDLVTRNIAANFWGVLYRDVLKDLDAAKTAVKNDALISDESARAAQIATIEVLEVYAWHVLVNTYGNVPYTDALNIDKPLPAYDDAKSIYTDLFKRLDAAVTALKASSSGFSKGDLIYDGDNSLWVKFASSLQMRMALCIADEDAVTAKTKFEAAAADAFTSSADNATFHYLVSPPNTNPIWVDLVQSGRKDFIASQTLVKMLDSLSDPRKTRFITKNASGNYTGGVNGTGNSYKNNSKPATTITAPDAPSTLISYTEVEFMLAEAAARGWSVSGTAAEHYAAGVTESILEWGGSETEASDYLSQSDVDYASTESGATWQEKIGNQKWLALYNHGFDAWTEWRRLDFPVLVPADGISVPTRFTYPVNEQTINSGSYSKAASAIGGDKVTTKLFWDKN
ncbi:MAG: SusD/RagB family nutrient-binding outer membrane lipoprotein [Chitinophagaceae bacterium]